MSKIELNFSPSSYIPSSILPHLVKGVITHRLLLPKLAILSPLFLTYLITPDESTAYHLHFYLSPSTLMATMVFQFIFYSCSLQFISNIVVRVNFLKHKWDHGVPSNKTHRWLPITLRIKFIIFTIACRAICDVVSAYFFDLLPTILLACSALATLVSLLLFLRDNRFVLRIIVIAVPSVWNTFTAE